MKAKQYLRQLEKIHNSISRRQTELEELRLLSTSIGSFDYSKDLVDTSKTGDTLERKVISIADKEFQVLDTIEHYLSIKQRIICEIESLDDGTETTGKYVTLLYKRYVEFKSLELVSCEMSFAYPYIKHMHGEALSLFQEKILNKAPNSTK